MRRRDLLRALGALAASSCARREAPADRPSGPTRLVFKHQPLWGDLAPFRAWIAAFERDHPGVEVATELLPNASDVVHQYFLTALEGGARDFDVLVADVVWVAEFARAGWIADLSAAFPSERLRRELLPGPADAVILGDRTFAMPWYVDVGVLYRRSDLAPDAPRTPADLERQVRAAQARAPIHGYVWQGRQYEGLICNVYEAIWSWGGAATEGDRVLLDTPEALAALTHMRARITEGLSPPSVTSMAEEEARRVFQSGRAVFMRNWPYAFAEAERAGSPIRGRVALSPLPTVSGEPGYGALGGWQLALASSVPAWKRDLALRFIDHLTSLEANVFFATTYARNPPRRAAYADPRVRAAAPFIADLLPMIERARPRPVTPYYPMIADTLQAEFSAAITGVRAPAAALRRAQAQIDHLVGLSPSTPLEPRGTR